MNGTSPRLHIWTGHPGDGRSARLLEQAMRSGGGSLERDWMFCVPSKSALRQIERKASVEAGLLGRPAATLEGLAEMVLAGLPPGPGAATPAVERVFLDEALRAQGWEQAGVPDFQSAAANTFRVWAHNGLWNKTDLRGHCEKNNVRPTAFDERLFALYGAYRRALEAAGLADGPLRLRLACEALASGRAAPPFRRLYVDGFYDLTPLERKFLAALCPRLEDIHVCVDWAEDMRAEVKALPEKTLAFWRGLGKELGGLEEQAEPSAGNARQRVCVHLFKAAPGSLAGLADSLQILAAANMRGEVEALAEGLARLHHEEGVAWEDMAAFFRDADAAMPLVLEIFPGYGIPVASPWEPPLAGEPLVAGILSFLRYHESGLALDLLDAIASPHLRPEGFPFNAFRRALAEQAWTRGSLEESGHALEKSEKALRFSAGRLFEDPGTEDKAGAMLEEAGRIAASRKALESWRATMRLLPGADDEVDGAFFREALLAALAMLGLPDKLPEEGRQRQSWNALEKCLTELAGAFVLAEKKTAWRETVETFREILAEARMPGTAEREGVLAGRMLEMRGLHCRVLAAGGLMEGAFPAPSDDGLLGGAALRESLHRIEPRLESWFHFHAMLNLPERAALLSGHDNPAKGLRPAPFLTETVQLINGRQAQPHLANGADEPVYYSELSFARAAAGKIADALLNNAELPHLDAPGWVDGNLAALAHSTWLLLWREQATALNAWDGVLERGETLALVRKWAERQNEKGFSASQLEQYADCNFKYFAERLLGLDEIEEPSEEVSVLDKGLLIHAVLAGFYRNRRGKSLAETEKDSALRELEAAAVKELQRYPNTLPWRVFAEQLPALWEAFVDAEIKDKNGFAPYLLEASFGMARRGEDEDILSEAPLMLGGFRLRGKVDRIDRNAETGEFRVLDYKSGAPKNRFDEYKKGRLLQLPLYLLAARPVLGEGMDAGAALYFVNPGAGEAKLDSRYASKEAAAASLNGSNRLTKIFHTGEEYEAALRLTGERVAWIFSAMSAGRFPVKFQYEADGGSCRYCSFSSICQKNERRMAALWENEYVKHGDFYWPEDKAEGEDASPEHPSGKTPVKPSKAKKGGKPR